MSQRVSEQEIESRAVRNRQLGSRILLCGICKQTVADPKQLGSCLHSFCSKCIDQVIESENQEARESLSEQTSTTAYDEEQKSTSVLPSTTRKNVEDKERVKCPCCDVFTDKSEILEADFLKQLAEAEKSNLKLECLICLQCKKDGAQPKWKCLDCKICICNQCREMHKNIPILEKHRIVEMLEMESKNDVPVIDKLVLCSEHITKPLDLNCKSCETILCSMCAAQKHSGHITEAIDAALERNWHPLREFIKGIEINIISRQNQIGTLTHKISETKQHYTEKRLELDDKLDIITNKLKELKIQLHEDLTKQELVSLEELKKQVKQLENKQNQQQNVIDQIKACESYSRHVSQLQFLQSGIYKHVWKQAKDKTKEVNFIFRQYEVKPVDEITPRLEELIAQLTEINATDIKIDVEGSWTEQKHNNKTLVTANNFFAFEYNLELETEYPLAPTSHRLSMIDSEIWLPVRNQNKAQIFSLSGQQKETRDHPNFTVIKIAFNGDLIMASDNGLYISNKESGSRRQYDWTKLSPGKFSDISVYGEEFAALRYDTIHSVYRFRLQKYGNEWRMCTLFEIPDIEGDSNSTLTMYGENNNNYAVNFHENTSIHIYSSNGFCIKESKVEQPGTFLCGVDSYGDVLVANFRSGYLWLLDTTNTNEVMNHIFPKIELKDYSLCDIIIDSEDNIWCLCEDNKDNNKVLPKLLKYHMQYKTKYVFKAAL